MASDTDTTKESPASLLQREVERLQEEREVAKQREEHLLGEFAAATTADQTIKVARKAITDLLPKAIVDLGNTLDDPDAPASVRAGISKFVVAAAMDRSKLEDGADGELRDLLKGMANKAEPVPND